MPLEALIFYVLALVSLVSGAVVVLSRNALYSALGLIVALLAMSMLFLQLGAGFLAAIQVLVYAGAVMVLFVFIIMLLNLAQTTDRRVTALPGKLLGTALLGVIFAAIVAAVRGVVRTAGVPEAGEGFGGVVAVGRVLFGEYLLPFELSGILLLAAILGTIVIARRKA
jgi:NADH-quinone oxidoreductase subunit J